jgi:glycosyltransferase involved in cell wall biosynthesis
VSDTGSGAGTSVSLERELTVVIKTFQRPKALRRLVASIRRFFPDVPVVVVDDSSEPLEPPPDGVTLYRHLSFNSLGVSAGRNLGVREVETPYTLICDDDMEFGRKTDVAKMLGTVQATRFDLVSCRWLDHEPWRSIPRGYRRYEGTLDVEDGVLYHRLGATRGEVEGLPVFDIVHQFFVAPTELLRASPWEERFKVAGEHVDFFLRLKERAVLCTRLPDATVYHRPQLPESYASFRGDTSADNRLLKEIHGLESSVTVGKLFTRSDRVVHELPGTVAETGRRAVRVARRLVREGKLRA